MSMVPPLQKGLFKFTEDGLPRLLANRCTHCDRIFFPRRTFCGQCCAPDLQDIELSARGRVHCFSLIDRKPKAAVIEPPYLQAEVAMPEGVHVFTVLDHCTASDVHIGMEVEVYVDEVNAPGGSGKAMAYKFKPVFDGATGVAA